MEELIMSRRDETIKELKKLIDENPKMKSQPEVVKNYKTKYKKPISQSTVSRCFEEAKIRIDRSTGYYSYKIPKTKEEKIETSLKYILSNQSHGTYSHTKGLKSIWLEVRVGYEYSTAIAIAEYAKHRITILPGIGCLYIKFVDEVTQNKLLPILRQFNISYKEGTENEKN